MVIQPGHNWETWQLISANVNFERTHLPMGLALQETTSWDVDNLSLSGFELRQQNRFHHAHGATTCSCTHAHTDDSAFARERIVGCGEFDMVADWGPPLLQRQIEFLMYRNHGDPKKGVQQCSLDH